MEGGTAYLTTHDLSIGYLHKNGEERLFDRLNVSLSAGELICFMGPNGAGKSSLLRTLAGLQMPLSGYVDMPAVKGKRERAQQIAVVLTDPVNNVNLTVAELIAFGRYPYLGWDIRLSEGDREKIQAAVAHVRLEHLLHRKIAELSDGQLQMVMIARALAQDTPLILMDEPTAHLDLNNRLEIMNLLKALTRKTGKAILVATHELDLALQTADRIWLTGRNRDLLNGLPEDLVLKGAFDEIFQFKGFDLKTGKVLHHAYRGVTLRVLGDGSAYLWTRNALERNGFNVTDEQAGITVSVLSPPGGIQWHVKKDNFEQRTDSLENLLETLHNRLQ